MEKGILEVHDEPKGILKLYDEILRIVLEYITTETEKLVNLEQRGYLSQVIESSSSTYHDLTLEHRRVSNPFRRLSQIRFTRLPHSDLRARDLRDSASFTNWY